MRDYAKQVCVSRRASDRPDCWNPALVKTETTLLEVRTNHLMQTQMLCPTLTITLKSSMLIFASMGPNNPTYSISRVSGPTISVI